MTDLTDVSTGDLITASRQNLINQYLESGLHRVNTLSLNISGSEIITSTGNVKPVKMTMPSGGLLFYASDGVTLVAKIDESGNLYILGGIGQL